MLVYCSDRHQSRTYSTATWDGRSFFWHCWCFAWSSGRKKVRRRRFLVDISWEQCGNSATMHLFDTTELHNSRDLYRHEICKAAFNFVFSRCRPQWEDGASAQMYGSPITIRLKSPSYTTAELLHSLLHRDGGGERILFTSPPLSPNVFCSDLRRTVGKILYSAEELCPVCLISRSMSKWFNINRRDSQLLDSKTLLIIILPHG